MSGWSNCKPAVVSSDSEARVTAMLSRGGDVLVITINSCAAARYFGGAVTGRMMAVEKDHAGRILRLRLSLSENGAFKVGKTGAGTGGRLYIARPFTSLPRINAKATACEVSESAEGLIVKVPSFALAGAG